MAYTYQNKTLHCDQVSLSEIAASAGTPCYVYSAEDILERYQAYDQAFGDHPHQVCYAVKANSNLSLLRLLAEAGAGFDIVSGGELYRVLQAGGDPAKTVFAGVGKTAEEIEYALTSKIHTFNCESEAELELIDCLARKHGVIARVGLRVNPDVDASTHPYISTGLREHKFGVDISEVEAVYARAKRLGNIAPEGVSCHIGSQLLDTDPMMETVDKMLALAGRLRANGIPIRNLDLGGGLGVAYKPEDKTPGITAVIEAIVEKVAGHDLKIMVEPGRSIVGAAGVLLTRVLYRKQTPRKEFIVVDAAMNDLIRPALYQSHHEIIPVDEPDEAQSMLADIVGPVCETGDFLARNREMPPVLPGALMAVSTAGAYGFVLSSNYNSRPRVPEVLVEGATWRIIRRRETLEDLIRENDVDRPSLRDIGIIFFRVGNVTFGSGAASTVQLREEIVEDRGWLGKHQFALCYALARVTPGTNLFALFSAAGWYLRGWPGAIVAIAAASLPASIVVILLTLGYLAIYTSRLGQAAIVGAMAAVVGTIIAGAWLLIQPDILSRNWFRALALVAGSMILSLGFGVSPIPIVGLAALTGFFWQPK